MLRAAGDERLCEFLTKWRENGVKISRSERFCGRPDYEEKRLEPRISEQLHLHMIEKDVSRWTCHTLVLCVKYSAQDEKTARSIFFCHVS